MGTENSTDFAVDSAYGFGDNDAAPNKQRLGQGEIRYLRSQN